jgi:hypothetical protein
LVVSLAQCLKIVQIKDEVFPHWHWDDVVHLDVQVVENALFLAFAAERVGSDVDQADLVPLSSVSALARRSTSVVRSRGK